MILHISFIWADTPKPSGLLSPIFDLADDWFSYGTSFYVLFTSEDMYIWQKRLMAVINESDSLVISEISNPHNTAGWMSQTFWQWLRKERGGQTIEGTSSPLLPLLPSHNPFKS